VLFRPALPKELSAADALVSMRLSPAMTRSSVDFVLTDPPYLVNYASNDGRTVPNDDNDAWLTPAFTEIYRTLRWNRFCASFYSWNKADKFIAAWRDGRVATFNDFPGFPGQIEGHQIRQSFRPSHQRRILPRSEQFKLLSKRSGEHPEWGSRYDHNHLQC
jgi:hypothetical protein